MTQAGGTQDFAAAAARHADDADHLLAESRHISADHLAGFAAECFLKAILLGFLGGQSGKIPFTVDPTTGTKTQYKHLPKLWDDARLHLQGRSGATLAGLLVSANPFTTWDVSDRYTSGSHISLTDVQTRVRVAKDLGFTYQQAVLNGTL